MSVNNQNSENLEELFEKFLTRQESQQAAEDIHKAEQTLAEHSAPEPDERVITGIKAEIEKSLAQRAHRRDLFRKAVYRTATVAAAFIIVAAISVKLFEKAGSDAEKAIYVSKISEVIWESDDMAADDEELATLDAEIEQIQSELIALKLGENGSDGYIDLTEIETELVEINGDLWKG